MNSNWRSQLGKFWITILLALSGGIFSPFPHSVLAQIVPDGTLGNESSYVTNDVKVRGALADLIEGGAIRDSNLFHSFQEFNVGELQRVYFANPAGIENILSRVTGSNLSQILGTLGVDGDANLFFINPNGIVFGENARLDITGSFIATTADGIKLGEDGVFSATEPQNSQLLSVQPGALFTNALRNHQAQIRNQGILVTGKNLTLAADNLYLFNQLYAGKDLTLSANNIIEIRDSLETPFIAAAGENLLLESPGNIDIFALNDPDSGLFAGRDLILRSDQQVGGDAHFWSGGSFRVENLDGSLGGLESLYDPIIRSLGDVSFAYYQGASLHILAAGKVEIPGYIYITNPDVTDSINPITTPDLANISLSNETPLTIDGSQYLTVDIRAGMNPDKIGIAGVTGTSGIFADSLFNLISPNLTASPTSDNSIIIGDIYTDLVFGDGGRVFLTNNYEANTNVETELGGITVGEIDTRDIFGGGAVVIDARSGIILNDVVNVSAFDLNFIFPNIFPPNTYGGNGGNVKLLAEGDITVNSGANIFDDGLSSGNIIFNSQENITVTNSTIGMSDSNVSLNATNDLTIHINQGSSQTNLSSYLINNAINSIGIVGGTSTINLHAPEGKTVTFAGETININKDVTLQAAREANLTCETFTLGVDQTPISVVTNVETSVILDGQNSNPVIYISSINDEIPDVSHITVNINDLTIQNGDNFGNGGNGGGISTRSSTLNNFELNITNSKISNNFALRGGGIGIDINSSTHITDSIISNNSAFTGGGIWSRSGYVDINHSSLNSNDANDGGGIADNGFELTIINSKISNNSATRGGGIFNVGDSNLTITNSNIFRNSANIGGGIFNSNLIEGSLVTISNSALRQNTSTDITNDITGIIKLTDTDIFENFIGEGGAFITTGGDKVSITSDSFILRKTTLITEDNLSISGNQITFQDLFIDTSNLTDTKLDLTATDNINITNSILKTEGNNVTFNLTTPLFTLKDTDISSNNLENNQSGKITLINSGDINLDNSVIISTSEPGSNTTGDNISIQADALNLVNFSLIDTSTYSTKNAGNIDITANNLSLNDNSIIRSLTTNQGNAGNISLNITGAVNLDNLSIISTAATPNSSGNSGNISIGSIDSPALSLTLNNGSQLQAVTQGNGKAGTISVNVIEGITIAGVGQDTSSTDNPLILTNITSTDNNTQISETSNNNDTLVTAQPLTEDNFYLNTPTNSNSDVDFSTRIPYTSISGTGENAGEVDIYKFEVKTGTRIVFDIDNTGSIKTTFRDQQDNTQSITSASIDIKLTILDSNENELTSNDNTSGIFGGDGSDPTLDLNLDPYLRYTFSESGTYYLKVERVDGAELDITDIDGNNPIQTELSSLTNQPYTLNTSVETPLIEGIGSINGVTPSGIFTSTSGIGDAGNMILNAATLNIESGGEISAKTSGAGAGGTININAPTLVDLGVGVQDFAPIITVEASGSGKPGDINITTDQFILSETARITATATESATNLEGGGSITIISSDMDLAGVVGIFAETQSITPAGTLTIRNSDNNTNLNLLLFPGSEVSASTSGVGSGGDLIISAPESIYISGQGKLAVETSSSGDAGNIQISSQQINLADGVQVSALTTASGNGGSIIVNVPQFVSLNQSNLLTESRASGIAGDVMINTSKLSLAEGSKISASNQFTGSEGIFLQGLNTLEINNSEISASTETGSAGSLLLNQNQNPAASVTLTGNSNLSVAATNNNGKAGNILLNTQNLSLNGILPNQKATITAFTYDGESQGIFLENLQLLNVTNGEITASTVDGEAGSLQINNNQTPVQAINLNQGQLIVKATGTGNAGNLSVNTRNLSLNNNSEISAATISGKGGDINLQNLETLAVTNSQISASTVDGEAGSVNVNASESVQLRGQGGLAVAATSKGSAGNLSVNTSQFSISDAASISASNRDGQGGSITVTTNNFTANNGGQILTTTSGREQAGNINLKVADNLTLTGNNTGIFANTTEGSTGDGGNIFIDPEIVIIRDGATIAVNSQGTGKGGNIRLEAGNLYLDNGFILAETSSTDGGNITLEIADLLLMRYGSKISATAGTDQAGGNGGNINIDAQFIVAVPKENSDITANAFTGSGGNIQINTEAIFGLKYRERLTDQSDITASSEFGLEGTVEINTPDTDPSQGLAKLPEKTETPPIQQGCNATGSSAGSRFVSTGRGGLPPSPTETLDNSEVWRDVQLPTQLVEKTTDISNSTSGSNGERKIVQATGWIIQENGDIELVADFSYQDSCR